MSSFPAADEDYFHEMDGAIPLSADEIKGRNMWIVWTGGNDRLWNKLTVNSLGALDFLKTISSHPSLKFNREKRWEYFGLANEPCFEAATGPDPQRYGLWLDKRSATCPPDPFEDHTKYPGVKMEVARGRICPWVPTMAGPPGSSACARFKPDFDERPRRLGTPSVTPIRPTRQPRHRPALIAWA